MSKLNKYIINPRVRTIFFQPNKIDKRKSQQGGSGIVVEDNEWIKTDEGVSKVVDAPTHDDKELFENSEFKKTKKGSGGVVVNANSVISATHENRKPSDKSYTYKDEEIKIKPDQAVEIANALGFKLSKPSKGISPSKMLDLLYEEKSKILNKYSSIDYSNKIEGINSSKANMAVVNSLPSDEDMYDFVFGVQEESKTSDTDEFQYGGFSYAPLKKIAQTGKGKLQIYPNIVTNKPIVKLNNGKVVQLDVLDNKVYDRDPLTSYQQDSVIVNNIGLGKIQGTTFYDSKLKKYIKKQAGGFDRGKSNLPTFMIDKSGASYVDNLVKNGISMKNALNQLQNVKYKTKNQSLIKSAETPEKKFLNEINYAGSNPFSYIQKNLNPNSFSGDRNLYDYGLDVVNPYFYMKGAYNTLKNVMSPVETSKKIGNTVAGVALGLSGDKSFDQVVDMAAPGVQVAFDAMLGKQFVKPITDEFRFIPTKEELKSTFGKIEHPEALTLNEEEVLRTVNNIGSLTKKNELFNTDTFESINNSLRNLKKLQNKANKISDEEFARLTGASKESIPGYIKELQDMADQYKTNTVSSKSTILRDPNQLPPPPDELIINEPIVRDASVTGDWRDGFIIPDRSQTNYRMPEYIADESGVLRHEITGLTESEMDDLMRNSRTPDDLDEADTWLDGMRDSSYDDNVPFDVNNDPFPNGEQSYRVSDFDFDEFMRSDGDLVNWEAGSDADFAPSFRQPVRENLTAYDYLNRTYPYEYPVNQRKLNNAIDDIYMNRSVEEAEKQFVFDKPLNYIQRKLGKDYIPETNPNIDTNYLLPTLFTDQFSNPTKSILKAKDRFMKMPKGSVAASASSLSSSSKPLELSMVKDFVSNKLADVNFHGYDNLNGLGFPEVARVNPKLIKKQIDNQIYEINKYLDKKIPYSRINGTEVSYPKISLTKKKLGGYV